MNTTQTGRIELGELQAVGGKWDEDGNAILYVTTQQKYVGMAQLEALQAILDAGLRPVEASPLPGEEPWNDPVTMQATHKIFDLLESGIHPSLTTDKYVLEPEHFGAVRDLIHALREQATAPLREAVEQYLCEVDAQQPKDIIAARARLRQALAAHPTKAESLEVEWQPIETARNTGEWIWLAYDNGTVERVEALGYDFQPYGGAQPPFIIPTHWRPDTAPTPPAAHRAKGQQLGEGE